MSGRMPPRHHAFKHNTVQVGLLAAIAAVALLPFAVAAAPGGAVAVTGAAASASAVASAAVAAASTASAASANSLFLLSQPWESASIGSIDVNVLRLAISAATCAIRSGDVADARTLTVIDYSRPSSDERLWVFDLQTRELLYQELVAHGQGSGENMATTFSNEEGTHASSLGLFTTADSYVGRNGYSLRLQGLDRGFNDRAFERAIVMHGAPYVDPAFVKTQGRLGRSWGCPALRQGVVREVIDRVKGSGLLFAYYPDAEWLRNSRYLGDCGGATAAGVVTASASTARN